MAQEILIKLYGHIWPVSAEIVQDLLPVFPTSDHLEITEMLDFEKDMLRLCFEGIYFDMDALLPLVQAHLTAHSQGKIDYIDLEAWTLTRHIIAGKEIQIRTMPLNNVMDYSGH